MQSGTKQLRNAGIAVAFAAAVIAAYCLGSFRGKQETGATARRVLYYVDPMHPDYKADKPGIAPDCGMPLVPVYADGVARKAAPSRLLPSGAVSIDTVSQQLAGIRLASVETGNTTRTIHAAGRVVAEDTRVYHVNSGVDGFIRETFGDAVGTLVAKDQKLATYYAPDFLAAASGFLAANERVPGAVTSEGVRSIQNYTDRLRNLGMSDVQVRRIAATRQLPESIEVLAPAAGVILARDVSPGQHFSHDTQFYEIADLKRVWVVAEVFQQDEPYLRPGALAEITVRGDGRRLQAHITDSLPQSEAVAGTVKLRLEVDNPKLLLRPDMVVDVNLPVHVPRTLAVPNDAVINAGTHARVYVEHGNGIFEPREVETGWRTEDSVEILKGLAPGERVVVASTFLVDSESRLKSLQPVAGADAASSSEASEQTMAARP